MEDKEQLFNELYKRNYAKFYDIACDYVNNIEDELDLTQEIFMRIWENLDTYEGKAHIDTWAYKVAIHAARNYARDNRTDIEFVEYDDELYTYADIYPNATDPRIDLIHEASEQLTGIDKQIIDLFYEGYKYREIATKLNMSASAIEKRMQRIIPKLKKIIADIQQKEAIA